MYGPIIFFDVPMVHCTIMMPQRGPQRGPHRGPQLCFLRNIIRNLCTDRVIKLKNWWRVPITGCASFLFADTQLYKRPRGWSVRPRKGPHDSHNVPVVCPCNFIVLPVVCPCRLSSWKACILRVLPEMLTEISSGEKPETLY